MSQGIKIEPKIAAIDARAWDRLAAPDAAQVNPFVLHAFLKALEDAGTVGGRSGWVPQHLVLTDGGGRIEGVAPAYLKSHSQGEYIFDHGWAEAFQRAGGQYYPKLQIAVPFTPVPGPRFLVGPDPGGAVREAALATAAAELARGNNLSSVHATFVTEGEWQRLGKMSYLQRSGQQFHWTNQGYQTFNDFLAALSSRKRKTVRKEREQALSAGLVIVKRRW